jgi:PAS domain S-box-containing protein
MQSLVRNSKWLAATLSTAGIIASLSSEAEQFTGYSAQELVGRPITRILSDSSALQVPRMLSAACEWGRWEGEIVHQARSGKHFEARGTLSLLAGQGNHSAGYLLLSDLNVVSIPNKGEESIVTEIAGKLRTIAHDLNNPLAVIMGFAQLMILNPSCQGNVRGDVDKLYSELQRVVHVVEKLHGYAISLYDRLQKDEPSIRNCRRSAAS